MDEHGVDEEDFNYREITSEAPVKLEGFRFFETQHRLNKDPVPMHRFFLYEDKIHWGDTLEEFLKEKGIEAKKELIDFAKGNSNRPII